MNRPARQTVNNTLSLLARSRKRKVNAKVYNRFGEEACPLGQDPNYSGLECCYISAAELSTKWLKKCKCIAMAHYANGKLLIYIGRYDYPKNGVMEPKKITINVLRYLHRCIH